MFWDILDRAPPVIMLFGITLWFLDRYWLGEARLQRIETLEGRIKDKDDRIDTLKDENASLKESTSEALVKRLGASIEVSEKLAKHFESEAEDLVREKKALEEEVSQMERSHEKVARKEEKARQEIEEKDREIEQLEKGVDELRSKSKDAAEAVKKIRDLQEWQHLVFPLLSHTVEKVVREAKADATREIFEEAISTFAGHDALLKRRFEQDLEKKIRALKGG